MLTYHWQFRISFNSFTTFSLGCGGLEGSVIEVDMWLSSGSVLTNLRKNTFNMWTCQLNGTKDYKLIDHKYDDLMYEISMSDTDRKGNMIFFFFPFPIFWLPSVF